MPSDPFQMAMIHRTFRRQFTDLSTLIRCLPPGDTRRSKFVGNYLANLLSVLHHHHAAEDELLWPKLHERTPDCGDAVARGQTEHTIIAEAINQVQTVGRRWAHRPDRHLAEQLSTALDELSACAGEHFDHEERTVLPLVAQYVDAPEWQGFIDRGAAYVRPRNLWFSLGYSGFLLADASPTEQRQLLESLPVPLRIVVKLLGGHAYTQYRMRLYGAGVAADQP